MKNQKKEDNKNLQYRIEAMFEENIAAKDLYQEILPLIEDYFVADIRMADNGIFIKFLNNQTFCLEIKEVI